MYIHISIYKLPKYGINKGFYSIYYFSSLLMKKKLLITNKSRNQIDILILNLGKEKHFS